MISEASRTRKGWGEASPSHYSISDGNKTFIALYRRKTQSIGVFPAIKKILRKIASEIEESTAKVFDSLNDVLYIDSELNKR